MDENTLRDKPTEPSSPDPSSTDVSIDMTTKHFIPSQNSSPIHLQQVSEDSIVSLENEGAANAGISHENAPVHKNLYYKGSAAIVDEFYFEITLKHNQPSSVWLGFVSEKWFTLSEDEKFDSSLWETATWNYDTLTGALNYGKITYAHDPICTKTDITLGFGMTISKEGHSVFYVKDDEPAKEIVIHGASIDALYPAICLRQPHTDLSINSIGPFKYKGRERLPSPHKTPIGLFECSPDRRYAAVFSAGDGIVSLWHLDDELLPKLVSHISVPDLIVNGIETSQDSTEKHSHKLITLAVSNTTGNESPVLALSRYHATLPPGTSRIVFLNYASTKHHQVRPNKISGRIHILDDGDTLLILNATHLFVMSMKSRALLRTFNRNDLSISTAVPAIRLHTTPSAGADRPLKPFGRSHFIWHYDADHVTMWNVSTGRLEQSFRLTFQAGEMYDYEKTHNLVAFYGIHGLRIFTVQTGIRICEAERSEMHSIIVVAVKFVTVDDTLHLVTVDGNEDKYIIRIWNPLNGTIIKEIANTHSFSERFTYSYQDIKADEPLVKLVTPLMATVAFFTVDMSLPRRNGKLHSEDLDIENPSECVKFEGKSSRPTKPHLNIIKQQTGLTKCLVQVIGFRNRPATIDPEPWNDRPVMPCYWISENLFLAVGRHSVQIIDGTVASQTKIGIKFAWCLPFHDATIVKVRLMRDDDRVLRQIMINYEHEGKQNDDIIAVDLENLSISPKHASRFLYFADLNYAGSTAAYEHQVALERVLKSPKDALLLNEIEFNTMTSPVGHIVRNPPADAIKRLGLLFESRACRPLFYDHKHWGKSVLRDALDTQRFAVVAEIVKYCLQSVYTDRDFTTSTTDFRTMSIDSATKDTDSATRNTDLELGYVAIILEVLPAISRSKPLMATWIAQYLSNVRPSRFIQGYHEVEYDSRKSRSQVFARVEQLSNVDGFYFAVHNIVHGFPPLKWLKEQYNLYLAWWNKERLPRPVCLCIAPLYGLNRYPSDDLPFKLSVFAQLAFRQSSVFDEPAFRAFVQYKWNAFARRYYLGLLVLYISYALIYMIAVSVNPYTFEDNPGLKYMLLIVTIVFLFLFDFRPLWTRWHSLTYWSSIYHWVDRTAFVMVLVSTLLTSRAYAPTVDLQAWTVLVLWLFVIFNFRVYEGLGLFFTVLIGIMTSFGWLIIIMAAILFAFAHAMWILLHNEPAPASLDSNPFETFDGALKALWEFLGADFGLIDSWNAGRSLDLMRVLFTFLSTIVLLNVLIAILNNKYEDTRLRAQKTWVRNRAEFIATVEVFMLTRAQRQNKNWFPAVVFYEEIPDDISNYENTLKKEHPWIINRDENE